MVILLHNPRHTFSIICSYLTTLQRLSVGRAAGAVTRGEETDAIGAGLRATGLPWGAAGRHPPCTVGEAREDPCSAGPSIRMLEPQVPGLEKRLLGGGRS